MNSASSVSIPAAKSSSFRPARRVCARARQAGRVQANTIERISGWIVLNPNRAISHSVARLGHRARGRGIRPGSFRIALALLAVPFPFERRQGFGFESRWRSIKRFLLPSCARRCLARDAGLFAWRGCRSGAFLTDALARYQEADDPPMIGRIELSLGRLAWDEGDMVTAQCWFDARGCSSIDTVTMPDWRGVFTIWD